MSATGELREEAPEREEGTPVPTGSSSALHTAAAVGFSPGPREEQLGVRGPVKSPVSFGVHVGLPVPPCAKELVSGGPARAGQEMEEAEARILTRSWPVLSLLTPQTTSQSDTGNDRERQVQGPSKVSCRVIDPGAGLVPVGGQPLPVRDRLGHSQGVPLLHTYSAPHLQGCSPPPVLWAPHTQVLHRNRPSPLASPPPPSH